MTVGSPASSAERVVIVGGGIAGLSAAARLAQSGFPVTVLEASHLGSAASTRNQGWLHSGAWFAPASSDLARYCYQSLRQTIAFCPECVEPHGGRMIYVSLDGASEPDSWIQAWEAAGIPYEPLVDGELRWGLPQLSRERVSWTRRLPDRPFRPDVLLKRLAEVAREEGAEIRPGTTATGLLITENAACGVSVGTGEQIRGRLVILATGAYSQKNFSELFQQVVGRQSDYQLICLKTHLKAVNPGLTVDPFCVVDGSGFNHLPHGGTSVFGTNRWQVVPDADDTQVDPQEMALLDEQLYSLFPGGFGREVEVRGWAGTTVQAMHPEQVEPGDVPLPTLIDHSQQASGIENVLSIFPGRATLWPQLAEQVYETVQQKLGPTTTETARPPWVMNPEME